MTGDEQFVRDGWTMERLVVGAHRTNTYLLRSEVAGVVIDPAGESTRIASRLAGWSVPVHAICLTHAHWDHLAAAAALQRATGAPVLVHRDEQRLLRIAPAYARIVDQVELELPETVVFWSNQAEASRVSPEVTLLHAPGHTRGGAIMRLGSFVFTGDTLLRERAGSATPPFGDRRALTLSLHELRKWIRDDDLLFGGHGSEWSGARACAWLDFNLGGKEALET